MSPDEVLRGLRATPRHFAACSKGLDDAPLRRPPADGEWSVHELLAHLWGAANVHAVWIDRMLDEDSPTIRYVSARSGMKKTKYESQEFAPFLRDFVRERTALVKRLSSLAPEQWSRRAAFTGTTRPWSPSVLDLAAGVAAHERSHFDQIAAAATEAGYQA